MSQIIHIMYLRVSKDFFFFFTVSDPKVVSCFKNHSHNKNSLPKLMFLDGFWLIRWNIHEDQKKKKRSRRNRKKTNVILGVHYIGWTLWQHQSALFLMFLWKDLKQKHHNLAFQTVEEHMQLSFSHIMKHWKRNPGMAGSIATNCTKAPPGSRNVLLRFYPPQSAIGENELS